MLRTDLPNRRIISTHRGGAEMKRLPLTIRINCLLSRAVVRLLWPPHLRYYLYTMEQLAWGTWMSCSYALSCLHMPGLSPGHTSTATCRRLHCDWNTAATNATTVRSKLHFFGCRSIGDWSATTIPKNRRPVGDRSATGGRLIANWLEMGCDWLATGWRLVGDGLATDYR